MTPLPKLPPTPPCREWSSQIPNPFGYRPSLVAGIIFSAIFAASALCHAWQAYKYRRWWLLFFVLGAAGELTGWICRTVAYACPYDVEAFKAQLASLVMAPAYTTAGMYATLAFILPLLPPTTLRINRKLLVATFLIVDFVSLLLQAIGGGMAGAAFNSGRDKTLATNIMVSGIIFQLGVTCIFATLFEVVMWRGRSVIRRNKPLATYCGAMMLVATTMVIRGIFRSMELMGGWRSMLATTERFQIALEGLMMVIAVVTFNVWHPERLITEAKSVVERGRRDDIALQHMLSSK